jgi:hypothetical protein
MEEAVEPRARAGRSSDVLILVIYQLCASLLTLTILDVFL